LLLLQVLRRSEIPTTDPLEQVRRYHRDGMEFNYDSEWQHWIELESQKRLVEELKTQWEKKEIKNWLWGTPPPKTSFLFFSVCPYKEEEKKPKTRLKVIKS